MDEFSEFFPNLRASGSQHPSERQGTANQAPPSQTRNPADISLHELAPPHPQQRQMAVANRRLPQMSPPVANYRQQPLTYGVDSLTNSPPRQMMQRGNRGTRRSYTRQMTEKKTGKVPFVIIDYLALRNAKRFVGVQMLYSFTKAYFPDCVTPGSNSWEKSLRENLGKECYSDLFVKKRSTEADASEIRAGRKGALLYAVKEDSSDKFEVILKKWLKRHRNDLTAAGITDHVAWQKIVNGTMGLPDDDDQVYYHIPEQPSNEERNQRNENQYCEDEDIEEPAARRPRLEDEAQRAANALAQNEYQEYLPNGYQQNVLYVDAPQMGVPMNPGYQFNSYYNPYQQQPMTPGIQNNGFNYVNVNDYDANEYNDFFGDENDENQDPSDHPGSPDHEFNLDQL